MGVIISVFKSFRTRKSSVLFPILGVAVSVMSVIIISTVGAVGKQAVSREVSNLGLGGLMITPAATALGSVLTQGELETIRASQVVSAATPVVYHVSVIQNRKGEQDCILWGVDNHTNDIMHLSLLHGREISKSDIYSKNKVCLVDATYAKQLYSRENIVGKQITVLLTEGYETFTVIGVTDSDSSLVKSFVSDYIPCFVYLPYTVLRQASGDDFFSSIAVTVSENVSIQQAETALMVGLNDYSGYEGGYKIENMLTYSQTIEKILSIITVILSGIAGISLLISGISIMTVMLFSVGERTREIGIKKAIGAGFFDILFEFLVESVAISLIGTAIGIMLGTISSFVGCSFFSIQPVFEGKMILICAAVTAAFGIIFGIYPALRAARLDPAEALRRN